MLFPLDDAHHLKAWLTKKLPEVSDTDTDTLVDYVLALLTARESTPEEIRGECEKELTDFLNEGATPNFVDELFRVLQHRSYLPGAPPPPPTGTPLPSEPTARNGFGGGQAHQQLAPSADVRDWRDNKKRSYQETADVEGADGHDQFAVNGRAYKQPRRGLGHGVPPSNPGFGYMPNSPAQFAPYDQSQAGQHRAQHQAPPLPPAGTFPHFDGAQPRPYGPSHERPRRRKPCCDFEVKGFCARGNSCQFDHGSAPIHMNSGPSLVGQPGRPDDYANGMAATMLTQNFQQFQQLVEAFNAQQRGRGGKDGRGGGRKGPQSQRKHNKKAPFSADGPNNDKSKSTIVVESIPDEKFSEEAVREFFSTFGTIEELSLQPYKRMAILKFGSWEVANAAYRSPKVIFDNRFVKVFWFKGDEKELPTPHTINGPRDLESYAPSGKNGDMEPEIDMEEFMKKQEEAQRRHEENMQKKQDIEKRRQEVEEQQRELLGRHREARLKLHGKTGDDDAADGGSTGALRAQLAALQEEAKLLGLDPDADDASSFGDTQGGFAPSRGRGRGRGGRGRGGFFPPRGRGRGSFRGGRGGGDVHAAYAAYSLDNRTRVVAVSGVDFSDPGRDEALRQHLLGVGEFIDVETSSEGAQVTFKDRKTAERFYYGVAGQGGEVPGVEGKVEVAWVDKPMPPLVPAPSADAAAKHQGQEEFEAVQEEDDAMMGEDELAGGKDDLDYEQADEANEWGIE